LHKAINSGKQAELEKILDQQGGYKLLEISDKFGNLPLMVAIIKKNFE
jgi:hypothetical protein